MELIIGNRNYSSWSLRAWLVLAWHDLPFEITRIPLDQPDTRTRLAHYTDAGKVPVLRDGELTVWDSLAICEYVSEQYLAGQGWPEPVAARAEARAVCAEMHSGFPEIRGRLLMNCRATGRRVPVTPSLHREIERVDAIWTHCRRRYGHNGPWLFGAFSIADCFYAPVAFRFSTYGIPLSASARRYQEDLLNHPKLLEWAAAAEKEPESIGSEEVGDSSSLEC